jgi:hypothetical protein
MGEIIRVIVMEETINTAGDMAIISLHMETKEDLGQTSNPLFNHVKHIILNQCFSHSRSTIVRKWSAKVVVAI